MKGPGLRADLEVRRVWQCPRCGKIRKALGDVASMTCKCQPDGTFMRLQEPLRQVKMFPIPGEGYLSRDVAPEDAIDDSATDTDDSAGDVQRGDPDALPMP